MVSVGKDLEWVDIDSMAVVVDHQFGQHIWDIEFQNFSYEFGVSLSSLVDKTRRQ